MMVRNLDHRVEVLTPVEDPACQRELLTAMDLELADTELGWELHADGTWEHLRPVDGQEPFNSQHALMRRALDTLGAGRTVKRRDTRPGDGRRRRAARPDHQPVEDHAGPEQGAPHHVGVG